ncbi:MAG: outer membrane lipoprotein carrier protein LolA [Planctomycetota bacterium]
MKMRTTMAWVGLMIASPTGWAMAGEGCPLCLAAAEAEDAAAAAATQPAAGASSSGPTLVVKDPELDALLDRVDAAAGSLTSLKARVIYETETGMLADVQRRVGDMAYVAPTADEPQRMGVSLDVLVIDGVGKKIDQRYVFDGASWIEIDGDEKRWTRYAPSTDADDHPVTAMLPSNFDRDDLLKRYVVERRAVEGAATDPTPTIRLRPRNAATADFDYADVTFDADHTPTVIEMIDAEKQTRIELRNVERNGAVDAALLDVTPPAEAGWAVEDRAGE